MEKVTRILFRILLVLLALVVVALLFVRFSRYSDKFIYHTNGLNYSEFKTELSHKEYFIDRDQDTKIHAALFVPDSTEVVGTIIHFPGQGMHLNSSMQQTYKPLLAAGFQIFSYERRGFGMSTGVANDTRILKQDALDIFDEVLNYEEVKNKPVVIWGQSLGGTFATMTAAARQDKINGLILEGTFGSFPDVGKVYASVLNLENVKWVVPLVMNNDFPAKQLIKQIDKPVLILHSKTDKQIPYELGKSIYNASNKETTTFRDVTGEHIRAIYYHEEEYVQDFLDMLQ